LVSIRSFSRGPVFPPEELQQIRHTANDGACDRAGPGEENAHKHCDRPRVTVRLRASRDHHDCQPSKESSPSAGERTEQRANHETPHSKEERNSPFSYETLELAA
jgi:hypothetical protein